MELKQYITETLIQIIEGVEEAQKRLGERNESEGIIGVYPSAEPRRKEGIHPYKLVDFDVALTTNSEVQGGAKIIVAAGDVSISSKTTNQIKFSVPIKLPCDRSKG